MGKSGLFCERLFNNDLPVYDTPRNRNSVVYDTPPSKLQLPGVSRFCCTTPRCKVTTTAVYALKRIFVVVDMLFGGFGAENKNVVLWLEALEGK